MNIQRAIKLLVMILVTASLLYGGGTIRTGTNAAPELLIPVGARGLAMGGANISITQGLDAIYWNPAGLARMSFGASAMFSHMSYIADMPVNYFAVGATFSEFGTIGFSLKSLGIGDIAVTTEDFPDGTGAIISPTYVTVGLTYSRMLADRISVGVTTNLISERIDRISATGFSFDAGVQYSDLGSIPGLAIGVAVKNIGPQMRFDGTALTHQGQIDGRQDFVNIQAGSYELPSIIEIGASYTGKLSEGNTVSLVSMFQNNNFSPDEYKIGAEYSYRDYFFVRGGWNLSQNQKDDNLTTTSGVDKTIYIYGFTAGVGVHSKVGDLDVTVDYAYRDAKFFDANHTVSIWLGF